MEQSVYITRTLGLRWFVSRNLDAINMHAQAINCSRVFPTGRTETTWSRYMTDNGKTSSSQRCSSITYKQQRSSIKWLTSTLQFSERSLLRACSRYLNSNFALAAATWPIRRNIRVVFDSGPLAPLCENMTSLPKPEVYNVLHCRHLTAFTGSWRPISLFEAPAPSDCCF